MNRIKGMAGGGETRGDVERIHPANPVHPAWRSDVNEAISTIGDITSASANIQRATQLHQSILQIVFLRELA